MSDLTRDQVLHHVLGIKFDRSGSAYDRADILSAHDAAQRERIAQLEAKLAERDAELTEARNAVFSEGVRAGELQTEVDAWRSGGVTEEILRRQDGHLKVGKGCVLVREDDYEAMKAELHEMKVQCGKNAISHMTEYHRAERLEQEVTRLKEGK